AEYAVEYASGPTRRVLRRTTSESVTVHVVTSNFFAVLGISPRLGRAFVPGLDDRNRAVVVSDSGWRRLFSADPRIVGSTIRLDDADYAIVGTLAGQHLELNVEPDFFVVFDPSAAPLTDRSSRTLTVIGRVRNGATTPQAQAELQAIAARIAKEFPEG